MVVHLVAMVVQKQELLVRQAELELVLVDDKQTHKQNSVLAVGS